MPPYPIQYPGGDSTWSSIRLRSSVTKLPKSRPRTFAVMTMRRLPFSRLIDWTELIGDGGDFPQRYKLRQAAAPICGPTRFIAIGHIRTWYGQITERRAILAQSLRQAHDDIEASIAVKQLTGDGAANGRADGSLYITGVQAVSRQCRAIGTMEIMGSPVICSSFTSAAPATFFVTDSMRRPTSSKVSRSSP